MSRSYCSRYDILRTGHRMQGNSLVRLPIGGRILVLCI
jgi:hypothetical protein